MHRERKLPMACKHGSGETCYPSLFSLRSSWCGSSATDCNNLLQSVTVQLIASLLEVKQVFTALQYRALVMTLFLFLCQQQFFFCWSFSESAEGCFGSRRSCRRINPIGDSHLSCKAGINFEVPYRDPHTHKRWQLNRVLLLTSQVMRMHIICTSLKQSEEASSITVCYNYKITPG